MGENIYEETLDQDLDTPQNAAQAEPNPYLETLDAVESSRTRAMRQSVLDAHDKSPDQAAKVRKLADLTGLAPELVERNYDRISKRQTVDGTPYAKILEETPVLAEWATDPSNAAIAKDDMEQLGALEWLTTAPQRAFARSIHHMRIAELRAQQLYRPLTQEEQDTLNAEKFAAEAGGAFGVGDSWFRGAVTGGGELLANILGGMASAGPKAILGGAVGGVIGAAGGATAAGVGAIPGAIAGAKFGATAGATIGGAQFGFELEAGLALDEFMDPKWKDEYGQAMDPDVARGAAFAAGAMNAGLEVVGLGILARSFPGVEKLKGIAARSAIKEALKNPSVRSALKDAVKSYGGVLTGETAVEVAQRAVTIMAGEIGKQVDGKGARQLSAGEIAADLASEAKGALAGFSLLAPAGPILSLSRNIAKAQRSDQAAAFFQALGEGAAASKTIQRMPEAAQEFLERATKDGPIPELYAPTAPFREYFQGQGLNPDQVAAELTGRQDALQEAERLGQDLAIRTSVYAVRVAGTPHHQALAAELRLGADEMNAREAAEFRETVAAELEAQKAAAKESKSQVVRDQLAQQLEAAGIPAETAGAYAQLYESAFGAMAERAGVDPAELFSRYGLNVQTPAVQEAAPAGQAQPGAAIEAPGVAEGGGAAEALLEAAVEPTAGTPTDPRDVQPAPAPGSTVTPGAPPDPDAPLDVSDPVKAALAMMRENPNITREAEALRARAAAARAPAPKRDGTPATPGVESQPSDASPQTSTGAGQADASVAGPAGEAAPAAPEGERLSDDAAQSVPAPGVGLQPGRGAADRARAGRRRQVPQSQRARIRDLVTDARRAGYAGSDRDLVDHFLERYDTAVRIAADLEAEANLGGWRQLLTRISEAGGIGLDAFENDRGETMAILDLLAKGSGLILKSGSYAVKRQGQRVLPHSVGIKGAPGVVVRKGGRSWDDMRDILATDPDFPAELRERWLDLSNFQEDVEDAAIKGRAENKGEDIPGRATPSVDSILEQFLEVRPGTEWWNEVRVLEQGLFDELLEPPAPSRQVDLLETGEQQPRLPGAEAVRETETATPEFEAPFSLTSPVDKSKKGKQTTLFQGATIEGFDQVAAHLTPEEKTRIRKDHARKLVDVFNALPPDEDFAEAALAGEVKRGWYARAATALRMLFGEVDAPRFAALLAATSPQVDVQTNLRNTAAVWVAWEKAGRPTSARRIQTILEKAVPGEPLPAWINNSVRALQADDPTAVVLSGPKVHSFARNLIGDWHEVTNDTWIANFAGVLQKLFSGEINAAGTTPGKGPGYLAINAKMRRVAASLTEATGSVWTPAEVQETIWSWAKTLVELAETEGLTPEEVLQQGKLTDDLIAETPAFAELLATNTSVRRILEEAGYGKQLNAIERHLRSPRRGGGAPGAAGAAAQGQDTSPSVSLLRSARRIADAREGVTLYQGDPLEQLERSPLPTVPDARRVPFPSITDRQAMRLLEARARGVVERKTVPMDAIVATQQTFSEEVARDYMRAPSEAVPEAIEHNGKIYLLGGHHRAIAAWANGATELVVDVNPIDPAKGQVTLQQTDQAPAFYSLLSRVVASKVPTRASKEQILGIVRNPTNGIKADELKWSGLEEWLEEQEGPIAKRDLVTFLEANAITIEEVVLGETSPEQQARDAAFEKLRLAKDALINYLMTEKEFTQMGAVEYALEAARGELSQAQMSFAAEDPQQLALIYATEDARAAVRQAESQQLPFTPEPRYAKYTMPGGENYRELLLILPNPPKTWINGEPITAEEMADPNTRETAERVGITGRSDYRSSHWNEPNVLAHVRFNERTDSEGRRVLFLEEFQSDWHQEGRRKGYRGADDVVTIVEIRRLEDVYEVEFSDGQQSFVGKGTIGPDASDQEIQDYYANILARKNQQLEQNMVPDAPFKTTWPELLLKRMIRYAAENGFEVVAWTPGQVQADRYDLSKQVKIEYQRKGDRFWIHAIDAYSGSSVAERDNLTLQELGDLVGKEVADKVAAGAGTEKPSGALDSIKRRGKHTRIRQGSRTPGRGVTFGGEAWFIEFPDGSEMGTYPSEASAQREAAAIDAMVDQEQHRLLEGDDLRVGGEGMRGFYDKVVPSTANKYVKKWGAKVEPITLTDPSGKIANDGQASGAAVGAVPVQGIEITDSMRQSVLESGQALFQPARGSITFGADRQFTITLLERADLSTFLHESGHFFLEVMTDLADTIAAMPADARSPQQQQLLADVAALEAWLVDEDHVGPGWSRKQHEQLARGFEAYLFEGKAPSAELRSVFSRFRAWLIGIYRTLSKLDVRLNPEVRAVFDRMLATDQAIAEAAAEANVVPLFTTPESAGMTPEAFEPYKATIAAAGLKAREELERRLLSEVQREQEAQWKARRAEIEAEVTAGLAQQPVYRALEAMRTGRTPDGKPLMEDEELVPLKLSKTMLVEQFGKARVQALPRPVIYSVDGGLDPDGVAQTFGFDAADGMLVAIEQAVPFKQAVQAETERRMLAEHGSILLDGSLLEDAQAALANDAREEVIREELKALAKLQRAVAPFVRTERQRGQDAIAQERRERDYERRWLEAEAKLRIAIAEGRKQVEIDELRDEIKRLRAAARGGAARIAAALPNMADLRETARRKILGLTIERIKPAPYWAASRRAAQKALALAARQDFEGAIVAKQQELVNLALYREATAALEDIDKRVRKAKSYGTTAARARFGIAGEAYLDQVDGVLDRYEFTRVSDKVLARRASIARFVAALEGDGLPVELPPEILEDSRRINYRQIPYEELIGVTDGLEQLAHLARLKNRLLRQKEQRELDALASDLATSIREHARGHAPEVSRDRRPSLERRRSIADFFGSHRKLASILRELDGFEDGGQAWAAIMRPLNEAGSREAEMQADATRRFGALLERAFPGAAAKQRLYHKELVPAIGQSLSKMERLVIAMNWGNEGNRDRVRRAEGWNDQQVQAILEGLTRAELEFVQEVLDFINSYWPEIAAKEQRVTGLAPDKVEAVPIRTSAGEIRGGYFPLKYDDRLSARAMGNLELEAANLAKAASYSAATTKRGHTKARAERVKLPIRRDFGVIWEHVNQVIHDLSHHETLIDVGRIIGHRDVQAAIMERYGDRVFRQIRNTIRDVALGDVPAINGFERAVNHVRMGATVAALGWKFSVSMLQPMGLTNAMVRVGPRWVAKGLIRWLRHPTAMVETVEWIQEVSPFMRSRGRTMQREIIEIRNQVGVESGTLKGWVDRSIETAGFSPAVRQGIADSYFWMIQKAQQLADVPTWLGAYEKAMNAGDSEERAIALADQAVLDSQGGGQIKDLAQVQRGGPMMKLWTNFYSFFNVLYNQAVESGKRTSLKNPAEVGRLAGDYFLLFIAPATMGFFLREALRGRLDEEEPEDLMARLALENVSYVAGTMLGVREVAGVLSGAAGYEGPAGARAFSSLSRLGVQVGQVVRAGDEWGEAIDAALIRSLNDVAGVLFHYPASQIWNSVAGVVALSEGKTDNPAAVISGPPPKGGR